MLVSFEESLEIHAPVEVCYQTWRDFSRFPLFMKSVKEVHPLGDDVWRWVLYGPQGEVSTWELLLDQDIPDKLITWRTVSGPEMDMWLDVHFQRLDAQAAYLTVSVSLTPPDSPIGHLLLNLFGLNREAIQDCLQSFRQQVETAGRGRPPHDPPSGWPLHRAHRDVAAD